MQDLRAVSVRLYIFEILSRLRNGKFENSATRGEIRLFEHLYMKHIF